jgi:hypothetical protein
MQNHRRKNHNFVYFNFYVFRQQICRLTCFFLDVNPALVFVFHCVDVGNVSDISEVHASPLFGVEISNVCQCLCMYTDSGSASGYSILL